jgi:TadE-like protein
MSSFIAPGIRLRRDERGHLAYERGQALVEFALVLPFLLLIVLGMLDIGKAMHYRNDETHLANEAARFAAVNKNPGPGATLEESIRDQVESNELKNGGGSIVTPIQITICFPGGHGIGDPVKVEAKAEYKFLDFLGFGPTKWISGTSTMRLEKAWDGSNYDTGGPTSC